MKHFLIFIIFLISVSCLSSCSADDEEEIIETIQEEPGWAEGFPQVTDGSAALNIIVKTNHQANIYYIIADEQINSLSSEDLKKEALSSNRASIVNNGIMNISGDEVNDTITRSISGLEPDQTYYIYIEIEHGNSLSGEIKEFINQVSTRQKEQGFNSEVEDRTVKYLVYKPAEYEKSPEKSFPLLVFLAGRGEVSQDGEINLLQNGTLPQLIAQGNDYPFIIVSPQAINERWDSLLVDEVVEEAKAKYRVDEKRIYMTGISAGAFGTWRYAISFPDKVTAICPIAGGGDSTQVCAMKNVPVWAFHGEADDVVEVSESESMFNTLKECSTPPLVDPKLTLYPGVGHNSWLRTYDGSAGHDIFTWLLSHQKK